MCYGKQGGIIVKYSILDYSKEKRKVTFQVGVKQLAVNLLRKFDDIEGLKETEEGFSAMLSYQQIPEVVKELGKINTSIYSIVCE